MRWWPKRRPLGEQGERVTARYLRRNGYRILDRNVHLGRYEIDIIAQEDDAIVFVEVKTRRSDSYEDPAANITRKIKTASPPAAHSNACTTPAIRPSRHR